ncbi:MULTISPECIES: FkbM family methyltransferase [Acidiphilium]|uniref:Methyltransferase, FkbM family n=1 Tax=Acidiphilium rubrum TaxID=526 RepID=A0A8G2CNX1_ACIRU|nr:MULTISPECIES: FkbM family methyltransferase [Acidiphilium]SIR51750.1 methyltransferase, FkbM family [Acidiphilium rubrum]
MINQEHIFTFFSNANDDIFELNIRNFRIIIDPKYVSPRITYLIASQRYEEVECNIIEKVLSHGDRVIDIGSAIGLTAMMASRLVGPSNVFAFEANPELIPLAAYNFINNSVEVTQFNNILINRKSFEQDASDRNFYLREHYFSSSLIPDEEPAREVKIRSRCLEDFISQVGANAILCDIEGGEFDLLMEADLSGLNKLLIELHPAIIGPNRCAEIKEMLRLKGFLEDKVNSTKTVLCYSRIRL